MGIPGGRRCKNENTQRLETQEWGYPEAGDARMSIPRDRRRKNGDTRRPETQEWVFPEVGARIPGVRSRECGSVTVLCVPYEYI